MFQSSLHPNEYKAEQTAKSTTALGSVREVKVSTQGKLLPSGWKTQTANQGMMRASAGKG